MENVQQFKTVEVECEIFKRSERCLVYGGSYSGKTYFIQNLILRHHEKFKKIIICGAKNDLLTHPLTSSKTIFYENDENPIYDPFTDQLNDTDKRQTLLILDDVMTEAYNSTLVSKIYSKGRHLNLSVFLILQSFFPQGTSKSLVPMLKNNSSIQFF